MLSHRDTRKTIKVKQSALSSPSRGLQNYNEIKYRITEEGPNTEPLKSVNVFTFSFSVLNIGISFPLIAPNENNANFSKTFTAWLLDKLLVRNPPPPEKLTHIDIL